MEKGRAYKETGIRGQGRHRVLLLGDIERLGGPGREYETNGGFREELLRAVWCAVDSELTERQRSCFTLFYEEELTVRQIARRLKLYDSTVSRHLAAARGKVRRYASYCAFGNAPGGEGGESRFLHGKRGGPRRQTGDNTREKEKT